MKRFEEIDDCSWQEVYYLNGCYDQFFIEEDTAAGGYMPKKNTAKA